METQICVSTEFIFRFNFRRNARFWGCAKVSTDLVFQTADIFTALTEKMLHFGARVRKNKIRGIYVADIAAVLANCRRFMVRDFDIFLVANDKFGLFPDIAGRAGMQIVKEYKRPVLNRSEGDKGAYVESIFQIKGNC